MTDGQLYALYLELKGADRAARRERIAAFAALHDRDESTVRKRLDKLKAGRPAQVPAPPRGGAAARVPGVPGRATNPELIAAAQAIWAYKLTPDGPLPTHQAQALALSEGKLARAWPIASLNQAAARLGLNAAVGYARRMEAPYANFAHRLDLSGSRHFRIVDRIEAPLAPDGGRGDDYILQVCRAEQRNKRWQERDLLWLLVALDDYSRVTNIEYAVAPGESAELAQDFLVRTWRTPVAALAGTFPPGGEGGARAPDGGLGLPELLICDQGAFGKSQSTAALLDWLDVRLERGQPNNSRRNGRVERAIGDIKQGFERTYLATHGEGATCRLSTLREELRAFVRATNGRRHPIRPDRGRAEDWRRSMGARGVRECPADALRLATFRAERAVTGEGWLKHEGRLLEPVGLPHGLRGRTVALLYNRAGEMIALHDGLAYPVREARPVRLGEYASQAARPEPAGQALLKELQRAPRSGIGLFSANRNLAPAPARHPAPRMGEGKSARAAASSPLLPRQPVGEGAGGEVPGVRPPFERERKHRSLAEALSAVEEVLGVPLHAVAALHGKQALLARQLLERGLDKERVLEFASELKRAAGV